MGTYSNIKLDKFLEFRAKALWRKRRAEAPSWAHHCDFWHRVCFLPQIQACNGTLGDRIGFRCSIGRKEGVRIQTISSLASSSFCRLRWDHRLQQERFVWLYVNLSIVKALWRRGVAARPPEALERGGCRTRSMTFEMRASAAGALAPSWCTRDTRGVL